MVVARAPALSSLVLLAFAISSFVAVCACGRTRDTAATSGDGRVEAGLVVTGVSDDCAPALFTGSVPRVSVDLGDGGANVPLYDLPPTDNGSARQVVHYDGMPSSGELAPPAGCPASVRRLEIGAVTHTTTTLAFPITNTFHDLATCDGGAIFEDTATPAQDCVSKRTFTFTYAAP